MNRRALVTGATGVVGGHLAERLAARGWRLRAPVHPTSDTALRARPGGELVTGDLGDGDPLARTMAGVEVVFHLAAVTKARDEHTYQRVNVEGTRRVVEACACAAATAAHRHLELLCRVQPGTGWPGAHRRGSARVADGVRALQAGRRTGRTDARGFGGRGGGAGARGLRPARPGSPHLFPDGAALARGIAETAFWYRQRG